MMASTGHQTSFKMEFGQEPNGKRLRLHTRFIVALSSCLLLLQVASWANPKSPSATDPLFGLSYSPDVIRFEPLPQEAYRACSDLTNQRWDRRMWIFAKSATSAGELLVIGGFFVAKTGRPTEMADKKGAVLRLKGSECQML